MTEAWKNRSYSPPETVPPAIRSAFAIMWKSFFIAAGIFACVAGLELLVIDSAVVLPINGQGATRVFMAPDWAPWTLISAGAITLLNFCSLPIKSASQVPRPH